MILCIETATEVCSVALTHEGNTIVLMEEQKGRSHATGLTPLIEKLLASASIGFNDLSAIAVSKGPGSYTGLRIGVSVAKGIAFATKKPLIAVGSLDAMCSGFLQNQKEPLYGDPYFCPMIDARRMEVFNAVYDRNGHKVREVSADIIDENSFSDILSEHTITFFGDGADKCKQVIKSRNAIFVDHFILSASFLAKPVCEAWQQKRFEDLAYFEPYYLKDFIATVAKNQVLTNKKTEK